MMTTSGAIIDFEDAPGQDVVIPNAHYTEVTFSNAVWLQGIGFHDGIGGLGVDLGVAPLNNWAFPGTSSPIVIAFNSPANSVSIDVFDVGDRGARIEAYNGAVLVDFDEIDSLGPAIDFTFHVSSTMITEVRLKQLVELAADGDGIGWDNLVFETATVPEPSTLVLIMTALLSLGLIGRNRKAAY